MGHFRSPITRLGSLALLKRNINVPMALQNNISILPRFLSAASSPPDFDSMVKKNKVVIFMKGDPEEPRCGFSNAVVQILKKHGVHTYDSYDVLKDETIRQGIKEYSNWPTIPQIYIDGEFVGGCDIMIQMHQNGDLIKYLDKVGVKSALSEVSNDSSNNR